MDHFFKLLRKGRFYVRYDTGYNNIWFKEDTYSNRILIYNHIVELNCSDEKLTEIPDLPNVKRLDCSYNRLSELPELPNVTKLNCSMNRLAALPELPNVLKLHCQDNQLTALPELPTVKKLYCSYNKLTNLNQVPNVQIIYCHHNELAALPELPNVQRLYCYNNKLFSGKLSKWKIVWKCKKTLIKVYLVPKLFSKWKLATIRNRLSVEHKEAIICHPKTYYVRELYNENNLYPK